MVKNALWRRFFYSNWKMSCAKKNLVNCAHGEPFTIIIHHPWQVHQASLCIVTQGMCIVASSSPGFVSTGRAKPVKPVAKGSTRGSTRGPSCSTHSPSKARGVRRISGHKGGNIKWIQRPLQGIFLLSTNGWPSIVVFDLVRKPWSNSLPKRLPALMWPERGVVNVAINGFGSIGDPSCWPRHWQWWLILVGLNMLLATRYCMFCLHACNGRPRRDVMPICI